MTPPPYAGKIYLFPEQSKIENSIYEILKKDASDEVLKILPEECGELEMGYNTKDEIFYFVMFDPEFEDDEGEEIKLLAVAIDVTNNISIIKDFKIED